MFVVGVIMGVSLWLTDLGIGFTQPRWLAQFDGNWLRSHAYIPNILAGLTGSLVGVPVAAVILTSFYSQREGTIAVDRVNRLSKSAWYTFRDSVYEFCSEERIKALEHDMPLINEQHDDAFKALQEYVGLLRIYIDIPPNLDDLLAEKADVIRQCVLDPPQELANRMSVDPESVSMAWEGVLGAWNVLDQYVRLQRLEHNLDWFANRVDTMIRKWMSLPQNLFLAFVDLHGFYPRRPNPDFRPETMQDAAHALYTYIGMSDSELRTLFEGNSGVFGCVRVQGYEDTYEYALKFMSGLRSAVDHVELAY